MAGGKRKLKSNAIPILIVAFIVIIVVIVSVISVISKRIPQNPPGTIGNTAGNLNNKGLFVEDGDTVYFINPYDNNYIYKMNLDGSGVSLFMDVMASSLNSAGNFLYFNQQDAGGKTAFALSGNQHGIYRKKKNGNQAVNGIERAVAGTLVLIDNTLVYQVGDDELGTILHKAGTDGKNKDTLSNSFVNPACVIDGLIYFPDYDNNHYLSVLDPNTKESHVYLRERVHDPVFLNGYIYYISADDNYRLYRYNMMANTSECLTEDRVDAFNISGDHIYYQKNSTTDPMLIRIRADGSGYEPLASGNYTNINVTSYYVYFQDFLEQNKLYRVANMEGSRPEQFIIP